MIKKIIRSINLLPKKEPKVFGVGMNKTGTTSLKAIFTKLDYNVAPQRQQELETTAAYQNGEIIKIRNFVKKYQFFQDIPFSQGEAFVIADTLFPKSKFILTIRNSEEWYNSLIKFHLGILNSKGFNLNNIHEARKEMFKNFYLTENYSINNMEFYYLSRIENYKLLQDWSLLYNKDHYIKLYEERNNQILKYFQNRPHDLLVIDVTKEKDVSKILNFLKLPLDRNFSMLHENVTK